MILRWIIFIAIYIAIDIYAFQAIRTVIKNQWLYGLYVTLSVAVLGMFIYQISYGAPNRTMNPIRMYTFGFFLVLFLPKIGLTAIMLVEDIIRFFAGVYSKIAGAEDSFHIPSRRKFVSTVALGIAAIPFTSLLIGMIRGKYNYKVLKYALEFDDLPEAFDGYTITQISDVHSGSFDNEEKVAYGIDLINEQQSDVILFTGDLVNNMTAEMDQWKSLFGSLRAQDGVFSVLGNHDYGEYMDWKSPEAKAKNLADLKTLQKDMGWDLLLNEHRTLERDGQQIKLIGVENWGRGFKQAGDLAKASKGLGKTDFKVLMSHDPTHWKEQVKTNDLNYQLTLSGHTHGMQYGIEIPGWIKWSPAKFRYENWAGIYEEFGRYLNVNRGFGFIGYPGRVGIWPEVTVIELKKRGDTA